MLFKKDRKAQITVFVIIAIIIVSAAVLFFIIRANITEIGIPTNIEPVYNYYLSCLQSNADTGIKVLGEQGGYIEQPDFSSGTAYMPFSSQLSFMGFGIPYWFYVSGNGIQKEQVPSKEKMQAELDNYLKDNSFTCDFSMFYDQGYEINLSEAIIKTTINDNNIKFNVQQNIAIRFGNESWFSKDRDLVITSDIGKFYNLARKIYDNEKQNTFFENYALDILKLNAPVDGSDIGCSPKIWFVEDIRSNLSQALSENVPLTKIKGNYYTLKRPENKYYVQDIGESSSISVNFVYLNEWPMKLEVWPNENNVLKADPVGLQEGLGMLGFCYVPYHFVYDFAYPVLIQVYSNSEMFQFPVVVYINKNKPRDPANVESPPDYVAELCNNKIADFSVETYNTNLEPVEADIKFKCFDTSCNIGKTLIKNGRAVYSGRFPQCVNGYVIASREGYELQKVLVNTLEETSTSVVLTKKYKISLELKKGDEEVDNAIVSFTKDSRAISIAYPEQKEVELSQGQYQIKAYIYSNSTIELKGSETQKCVDVPRSDFTGFFGATEEKCFTLTIPDQISSLAVSGGGTENYFVGESELENSKKLIINAKDFGIPKKVEDLQINFNNIEVSNLDIIFK